MKTKTSTKVTMDLADELTPKELKSFREQAKAHGNSLQEHIRFLLFGSNLKYSRSPEAMKRKARPESVRECTQVHDQADYRGATQRFALVGERIVRNSTANKVSLQLNL